MYTSRKLSPYFSLPIMNNTLKKKSSKERITIVMVPYEQYSTFPKAVDMLYKNTVHPFYLIVVEGNAPGAIKSALEKRTQFHKNIKIIYTNHLPLAGEAYNLARPHLRTSWAFFMHNDLQVTSGWLSKLIECAKTRNVEIVCPVIESAEGSTHTPDTDHGLQSISGINMHGFLISKKALEKLGGFEENISPFMNGLDLSLKAKSHGILIFIDTDTVLKRNFPPSKKSADLLLFNSQWDKELAKKSFGYFREKWNLDLDEKSYLHWLEYKRERPVQASPLSSLRGFGNDLQSKAGFVRIKIRRLLDIFISL